MDDRGEKFVFSGLDLHQTPESRQSEREKQET